MINVPRMPIKPVAEQEDPLSRERALVENVAARADDALLRKLAASKLSDQEFEKYFGEDPSAQQLTEFRTDEVIKLEAATREAYVTVLAAAVAAAKAAGVAEPSHFVDSLVADDALRVVGRSTAGVRVKYPSYGEGGQALRVPLEKWLHVNRGIPELVDPNGPPARYARLKREFKAADITEARIIRKADFEAHERERRAQWEAQRAQDWAVSPIAQALIAAATMTQHAQFRPLLEDLARAAYVLASQPHGLRPCPDVAIDILKLEKFTPDTFQG